MRYYLYIVRCADKTLYTGIAVNPRARVSEHNASPRGAKYTRSRRPVVLVYSQMFRSRSAASRAEARVKRLTRNEKLALVRKSKNKSASRVAVRG